MTDTAGDSAAPLLIELIMTLTISHVLKHVPTLELE